MAQAQSCEGLISADARTINGIHHTLSIWENESCMRRYLVAGAHLRAMRAFKQIATGKTIGYVTTDPPDWSKVHDIWLRDGQDV